MDFSIGNITRDASINLNITFRLVQEPPDPRQNDAWRVEGVCSPVVGAGASSTSQALQTFSGAARSRAHSAPFGFARPLPLVPVPQCVSPVELTSGTSGASESFGSPEGSSSGPSGPGDIDFRCFEGRVEEVERMLKRARGVAPKNPGQPRDSAAQPKVCIESQPKFRIEAAAQPAHQAQPAPTRTPRAPRPRAAPLPSRISLAHSHAPSGAKQISAWGPDLENAPAQQPSHAPRDAPHATSDALDARDASARKSLALVRKSVHGSRKAEALAAASASGSPKGSPLPSQSPAPAPKDSRSPPSRSQRRSRPRSSRPRPGSFRNSGTIDPALQGINGGSSPASPASGASSPSPAGSSLSGLTETEFLDATVAAAGLTVIPTPEGFQCSQCQRVFKLRKHCRRHMVIHTGVRPFKCHDCPADFTRMDALRRHLACCKSASANTGDADPESRG